MKILVLFFLLVSSIAFAQEGSAEIKFEGKVVKLGKVKQNLLLEFTYYFQNTGTVPLIINNADVTCGCTNPKWPTYPVLPSAKDSITVTFDTKGKYGYQNRDIEIISNAKKASVFISFKCNVLENKNK
ncbi:MAG: DUF1573 domain-containing protein [Flavobacteriales bacterium]|nr:DUF1573 domain-containing protein [Flavobacteriales bacterium]